MISRRLDVQAVRRLGPVARRTVDQSGLLGDSHRISGDAVAGLAGCPMIVVTVDRGVMLADEVTALSLVTSIVKGGS